MLQRESMHGAVKPHVYWSAGKEALTASKVRLNVWVKKKSVDNVIEAEEGLDAVKNFVHSENWEAVIIGIQWVRKGKDMVRKDSQGPDDAWPYGHRKILDFIVSSRREDT